jgi:hypothetical protein
MTDVLERLAGDKEEGVRHAAAVALERRRERAEAGW